MTVSFSSLFDFHIFNSCKDSLSKLFLVKFITTINLFIKYFISITVIRI